MADKLEKDEELNREVADARIEITVVQSRMAVLTKENKRLRDKFNQITKESKEKEMKYLSTIDENLKQIDKLNENLEKSEIQKA